MGVLIIGPDELIAIEHSIAQARANPVPWEVMKKVAVDDRENPTGTLDLKDRGNPELIDEIRSKYPSRSVVLGSYIAAISFEEQPAGMLRHLSVSVVDPRSKDVPNEHVIREIMDLFGFSGFPVLKRPGRMWLEEYAAGRYAFNAMELEALP
jgi:hypothetical protein